MFSLLYTTLGSFIMALVEFLFQWFLLVAVTTKLGSDPFMKNKKPTSSNCQKYWLKKKKVTSKFMFRDIPKIAVHVHDILIALHFILSLVPLVLYLTMKKYGQNFSQ